MSFSGYSGDDKKVHSLSIRRVRLSIRKHVDLRPTCIRGSDVRVDAPPGNNEI